MLKIKRKGMLFVLSSPSGAGKTTISRAILEQDSNLSMSVSATTRKMRSGEVDGSDYSFLAQDDFVKMVKANEFLEYAEVFGNMYGTPKASVFEKIEAGKDVLFDIDWQGTMQLQKRCGDDVVSIFILPPSLAELESRLRKRAQDDESVIKKRMQKATDEISHWGIYDYVLVNSNIDMAVSQVSSILNAERLRRRRLTGLDDFVNYNLSE